MSTNTTPVIVDPITSAVDSAITGDYTAYVAMDRSGRAKVRSALDAALTARVSVALTDGDLDAARAAMADSARIPQEMRAATGAVVTVTVDWNALTANRIATLHAAADALLSGLMVIDGAPDDYVPSFASDPFAEAVTVDAVRAIATKRVTRSGKTNDVAAAITAALESDDADDGFMTVAAIRRHWSANGGPANADGRIAARLFATDADGNPACTVPGVVPVAATDTSARGARLITA